MPTLSILAGPSGLKPGTELTFFYPSTEWAMAQSFDCFCRAPSCKGHIAGASDMDAAQLQGMWLNGYIRDMLEERDLELAKTHGHGAQGHLNAAGIVHGPSGHGYVFGGEAMLNGKKHWNGAANGPAHIIEWGAGRMGPTSRELSGEMGGDTTSN
jgi:hypothetical protein